MIKQGIGIFGGSFDPVHKGHKKLALFMCEKLFLRKMLIIPAAVSPFKTSSGADAVQRMHMCSLQFPEDFFTVSDIEIKRGGKSYTVDTLNSIKELYPDEKLYLIIGSDQLLSFNRWYKFEDIMKKAVLCAVAREGSVGKKQLENFADDNLRQYGEVLIFDFEPFEVSSTEIREMINDGKCAGEFISPEVNDYILREGLYKE